MKKCVTYSPKNTVQVFSLGGQLPSILRHPSWRWINFSVEISRPRSAQDFPLVDYGPSVMEQILLQKNNDLNRWNMVLELGFINLLRPPEVEYAVKYCRGSSTSSEWIKTFPVLFTNALTKDYNPVRSKARLKKSVHRIMRVINRLLIFDVISFLRHRRPNCGGFPIESAVSFPLIKSACRKPILSFVRWSLTKRQASGTAPRGPRDVSRWLLFEIASHQSGTAGAYADVFPF